MDAFSQDPWTESQWTMVREAVRDEAKKQRVAASFLPVCGPWPEDAQTVPLQELEPIEADAPGSFLEISDFKTRRLTTLSVHVGLRSAQVAEPGLSSALVAFRRAANLIARTEDHLIFQGQGDTAQPPYVLGGCRITGGDSFPGLLTAALRRDDPQQVPVSNNRFKPIGEDLVAAVSKAISALEVKGHLGPFALALGSLLFDTAQTPNDALVLPADRIKPLLDGPLVRTSTLNLVTINMGTGLQEERASGVLVSLAANLLDLVVASEIDVQFLQVTTAPSPRFVYRVSERFTLRIKQLDAVVALT
jgi:uncharacterized linocin/CFP29 family protein